MLSLAPPPVRLLGLRDPHGAPLADFDWYPTLALLEIGWHGHLTATSLVLAIQAGSDLVEFAGPNLPRRLLTNHSRASGSWEEALPWLQYDWLPSARARGLRMLAHVISPDPASRLTQPDHLDFVETMQQTLRVQSFHHYPPAWHWLTRR